MSRYFFLSVLLFASNLSAYELGIVSMFYNEAPYIKEWIEYHRLAGVQHFWLYDNNSTDNSLDILQPYVDEGIVDITYWPTPEGSPNYIATQLNAFKDGIMRAKGIAEWVAFIDIDEFILPMKDKNILECLENHFAQNEAIYVNWRNFGTGGVYVPQGDPILFQLTACSLVTHSDNNIGKSIVRPEYVDIDAIWYAHHFPMLSNADYVNGDGKKMSFNGLDLLVDSTHHDQYIRINHYVLRDEWFFQNVRLAKAKQGNGDLMLLLEHYFSFSLTQDLTIINFIQELGLIH